MAITHSRRPISLSRPMETIKGATRVEVVTSDTVLEPCAVLSAAATTKGMNTPSPRLDSVCPR